MDSKQHSMWVPLYRQTLVISKFQSLDLQCLLDSQTFNRKGRLEMVALEPNRARQLAKELGLQVTLKRVAASSIEQVDDARFNLFTKLLWKGIYEDVATESAGYTVLLVPSYFDFVRLKSYMKRKNA